MREDWIEIIYKYAVYKISTSKQKLKQKEYLDDGIFPIVDQGQDLIGGYTNDETKILNCDLPVIVFGDHTKNIKLINFQFAPGADGTKVLEPSKFIVPEYISYLTKILVFKIKDKGYARHYQHIEKELLPLAPLPIQRAIVSKIESLFSDLDNGIANLKKAQEQLKIYRQAVLKKAFEGEFSQVKVLDISEVKTGSTPKRGNIKYWNNGTIPWITSGALNNLFVKKAKEFITETALQETNCKIIKKGSLLIAMYGEGKTRGKCSELNIDAATNQAIATITLTSEYEKSRSYVKWFFLKNYEEIRLLSSGGVQPNLNLSIIKNTVLPFPSLSEQYQIVQEIETRLSVCDKVEQSITESLEKAKALRQSILKKAFEGKLLTEQEIEQCKQAPDYEPASVLLEKIKAEKLEKEQEAKKTKNKIKK